MSNGNILVDDKERSLQAWLRNVYGWSSVQTYALCVHIDSGTTLSQIHKEYMDRMTDLIE